MNLVSSPPPSPPHAPCTDTNVSPHCFDWFLQYDLPAPLYQAVFCHVYGSVSANGLWCPLLLLTQDIAVVDAFTNHCHHHYFCVSCHMFSNGTLTACLCSVLTKKKIKFSRMVWHETCWGMYWTSRGEPVAVRSMKTWTSCYPSQLFSAFFLLHSFVQHTWQEVAKFSVWVVEGLFIL